MSIFKAITNNLNRYLLASHMPQGRLWEACFLQDTNLGLLIKVLAIEYYRLQVLIEEFSDEFYIRKTNAFIIEWEKSVGIPNDCLTVSDSTITKRRSQIEEVFGNFGGVQLAEDFERVALLFDYIVDVQPGNSLQTSSFPFIFPFTFNYSLQDLSHIIVVNIISPVTTTSTFTFTFPFIFEGQIVHFLQCIFDILAPANVKVLIKTA